MAKNKTTETTLIVDDFINAIPDELKRTDVHAIAKIYKSVTGFKAVMWGPGIIGFGSYHYKYESGREGDAPSACFSPRKSSIVLYVGSTAKNFDGLVKKLGKCKISGGCLHIKTLEDIDVEILKQIIAMSFKERSTKK